ncbi:MAG: enoyl-CoA hydratase/isomerase family protein [Xanthobacteraceae bacterium]|nr:enoyl-CoA hydratase/isomerase family protein [Xanthobacteraceae bacterium]
MTAPPPEVLFERKGAAGLITLNRPQALNAVTLGMVRALMRQLQEWRHDAAVTRIVVTAAGGKAFSAGGDIRALYDAGTSGRHAEMLKFYGEEYVLNTVIKHYPKPYIALIDGICMGGGVGVSVHGSHRVAGDRYLFAMPEVGIGFFPDVGATWFLPRLPGELGAYCALTGDRLGAADGVAGGIATHQVASSRFTDLAEALCGAAPVDATLAAFAEPIGAAKLAPHRTAIDRLFAYDRVEDILDALDADGSEFATKTAATIRAKSPTALKLALAQMRKGAKLTFAGCMACEFRIVSRVIHGHDFYEGVRAVIVDKDNAPRWRPASLPEVSDAEVARHFAPLGSSEWQPPDLDRANLDHA